MVNFAGHISLNLKVSFPACPVNLRDIKVGISSFFPLIYGPRASRLGLESTGKTWSVTFSADRENEVSKRYLPLLKFCTKISERTQRVNNDKFIEHESVPTVQFRHNNLYDIF